MDYHLPISFGKANSLRRTAHVCSSSMTPSPSMTIGPCRRRPLPLPPCSPSPWTRTSEPLSVQRPKSGPQHHGLAPRPYHHRPPAEIDQRAADGERGNLLPCWVTVGKKARVGWSALAGWAKVHSGRGPKEQYPFWFFYSDYSNSIQIRIQTSKICRNLNKFNKIINPTP
jgi:hypothetical protein